MASNSNALAEQIGDKAASPAPASGGKTLREALLDHRDQIAQALPGAVDVDRFLRLILTQCRQTPKLMQCSFPSIMAAAMQSAQLNLEPGPLGQAYLVPFDRRENGRVVSTECTFIIGYQGYLALFQRAGVTCIARKVCEADEWTFHFDEDGDHFRHVPAEGERGKAVRYYAVATLPSGQRILHVLSRSDVEQHRARSKAKDSGPWKSDYDAMACKTVVRDMARWVPKSIEFAEALSADEAHRSFSDDEPALTVTTNGEQPALDARSSDEPEGEWDDPDEAMPGDEKEALV